MPGRIYLRPAIGLEKGANRVARRLFEFFIGGRAPEKDHHLQVGIAECYELPGGDVVVVNGERPPYGQAELKVLTVR